MKVINTLKTKKFWSYVLVLAVGAAMGVFVYAQFFAKPKRTNEPDRIKKAISEQTLSNKKNLDEAYKMALKRVDTGVERKELTSEQAAKLKQKLSEIYEYRKSHDSTGKTGLLELNKKRQEWRVWLDENKLSLKYIIPVYWN